MNKVADFLDKAQAELAEAEKLAAEEQAAEKKLRENAEAENRQLHARVAALTAENNTAAEKIRALEAHLVKFHETKLAMFNETKLAMENLVAISMENLMAICNPQTDATNGPPAKRLRSSGDAGTMTDTPSTSQGARLHSGRRGIMLSQENLVVPKDEEQPVDLKKLAEGDVVKCLYGKKPYNAKIVKISDGPGGRIFEVQYSCDGRFQDITEDKAKERFLKLLSKAGEGRR